MQIKKESVMPLGFIQSQSEGIPKHLVHTVVEDLQIGEYRIKYRMRPVIFLRIYNWRETLTILKFDPQESGSVILSDYREVILIDDDLEYYFNDVDSCRVVLIGDEGYSSFKIEFY